MDEQPKRKRGRPFTGRAKEKRNIRVGEVWDQAAELAAARGETMTTVVERALKNYVHRYHVPRTDEGDQGDQSSRSTP